MAVRLVLVFGWTVPAMLIQAVLLGLPGRGKERFAMWYWRGVAAVLGIRVTVLGERAVHRPVLFVANHCSWLDIVTLGSVLPGCFVAKGAVASWPLINWIARLGRTIFVSRNRATVGREQSDLLARLAAGDNVILFPEGTTSDGVRVLAFSSSFLALASAPSRPCVQAVTLVYDMLDGLPVRRCDRPGISWYGDMDLASHYNVIGRRRSLHATMVFDAPIAPGAFANRKALAAALEARLAENAAELRQGRATRPAVCLGEVEGAGAVAEKRQGG
jgi:1-acyl-sn-glycerol-3-phosphate acyltransferase